MPKPLPLPGQLKPLPKKRAADKEARRHRTRRARRCRRANTAAKIEPSADGFINAIQVYPYTKGALYQLYGAVNQVTDIALEGGEKLVSVSAGDTVRWIVGDTTSGEGKTAQVHILVKPIAADLTTNLVITTDRRTYHLELNATDKTYMASVSWTYPPADLIALKRETRSRLDHDRRRRTRSWRRSSSATASRAMRPGSRSACSMTASRSTSSSRPA